MSNRRARIETARRPSFGAWFCGRPVSNRRARIETRLPLELMMISTGRPVSNRRARIETNALLVEPDRVVSPGEQSPGAD